MNFFYTSLLSLLVLTGATANNPEFGCNPIAITDQTPYYWYICTSGGQTDLFVTATGDNLTYQWQIYNGGWQDLNGAMANTYTATVAGIYQVVISSTCGPDVTSGSINVTSIHYLNGYGPYWNGTSLSIPDTLQNIQWWFGANPIPLANTGSYTPTLDGPYSVHFSYGNCDFISSTYNYSTVGIAETNASRFSIFPNPAHNTITIETAEAGNFVLSNVVGKALHSQQIQNKAVITLEHFAAGIYFLTEVNSGRTIKVIKE